MNQIKYFAIYEPEIRHSKAKKGAKLSYKAKMIQLVGEKTDKWTRQVTEPMKDSIHHAI
jgi:hypothetical protein